jgi:hypothetical protein
MNLQQILDPIAKLVDETFITILVPISDLVNWAVIALGFVGLGLWIKMQQSYTAKAKRDNTLV